VTQLLRVVRVGKVLRMLRMYRLLRVTRLPRILERIEGYLDQGVLQVTCDMHTWSIIVYIWYIYMAVSIDTWSIIVYIWYIYMAVSIDTWSIIVVLEGQTRGGGGDGARALFGGALLHCGVE
jgi:hypothetical protein